MKKVTISENETKQLGEEFAKKLKPKDIVLLEGPLGAGKTTFMQGVASGLKIESRIISPTFVLMRSHKGILNGSKINIYHIDLYRMEDEDQIKNLGLDEVFEDPSGVTFIEWGRRSQETDYTWEIEFEVFDSKREITIKKNE